MPKTAYRPLTRGEILAATPTDTLTNTRYSNDSRVEQDGRGGVYVDTDDGRFHVTDGSVLGWTLTSPNGRDQVRGFDQADHAIFRLIGSPEC